MQWSKPLASPALQWIQHSGEQSYGLTFDSTTTLPPATITDFAAQELSRLRKRQSQGQVAATPEVFTSSDGNVCTVGERIVGRFGTNVCTLTTVTATTTAAAGASTATITVTSLETSTLNLATVLTNGVTSVASTTRTVETFTTVPTTTRGTTTLTGTTTSTRTTVETETPPPVNVTLREFTLTSSCVDENCTGDGLYCKSSTLGRLTFDWVIGPQMLDLCMYLSLSAAQSFFTNMHTFHSGRPRSR